MNRRTGVVITCLFALPACAATPTTDTTEGCLDVDSAVIDEAMASTRSNFETPDGVEIDRLKFDDAASVMLPADQQKFGVASVMALRVAVFYAGDEADTGLSGVEIVYYLALDSKDQIIAPLGTYSEPYFDLERPADPGWSAWAEEIDDSDTTLDAFGCVNPN